MAMVTLQHVSAFRERRSCISLVLLASLFSCSTTTRSNLTTVPPQSAVDAQSHIDVSAEIPQPNSDASNDTIEATVVAIADRDGDGVADDEDACGDTPGAPQENRAQHGCAGLVLREGRVVRLLQPVRFAIERDRLRPEALPILRALTQAIRSFSCERVEVQGHLGHVDPYPRARSLSQDRANTVRRFLIEQGISAQNLVARGYGAERPLVPLQPVQRSVAINARIEIHLLECQRLGIASVAGAPSF